MSDFGGHEHVYGQVTISSKAYTDMLELEEKIADAYYEVRDLIDLYAKHAYGDPVVTGCMIGMQKAVSVFESHLADHIERR